MSGSILSHSTLPNFTNASLLLSFLMKFFLHQSWFHPDHTCTGKCSSERSCFSNTSGIQSTHLPLFQPKPSLSNASRNHDQFRRLAFAPNCSHQNVQRYTSCMSDACFMNALIKNISFEKHSGRFCWIPPELVNLE